MGVNLTFRHLFVGSLVSLFLCGMACEKSDSENEIKKIEADKEQDSAASSESESKSTSTTESTETETEIVDGTVAVAVGFTCAIKKSGEVQCFGSNENGAADPPNGEFQKIAAGKNHVCGILKSGSLKCWGDNEHGQSDPPTGKFRSIASGTSHSCAVDQSNSMQCWGYNNAGQSNPPEGLFSDVSAGGLRTCGLKTDQTAECWGEPVQGTASLDGRYKDVSAADYYHCGIHADGEFMDEVGCWGNVEGGQLEVPSGKFRQIATASRGACALDDSGSVECWGDKGPTQNMPGVTDDVPMKTFIDISVSANTACGLTQSKELECWGMQALASSYELEDDKSEDEESESESSAAKEPEADDTEQQDGKFEEKATQKAKQFANAVACDATIDVTVPLVPYSGENRLDAKYLVLWKGNPTCCMGTACSGQGPFVTLVKVGAGESFHIDVENSYPSVNFNLPSKAKSLSMQGVVDHSKDSITFKGIKRKWVAAQLKGKTKYRITMRANSDGDWVSENIKKLD